jgi:hypothetical protein
MISTFATGFIKLAGQQTGSAGGGAECENEAVESGSGGFFSRSDPIL